MDKSPAPGSLLSRQGLEKTLSGLISFQSLLEGPLGDLSTAGWGLKGVPSTGATHGPPATADPGTSGHQNIWRCLESPAAPGDVKAEP